MGGFVSLSFFSDLSFLSFFSDLSSLPFFSDLSFFTDFSSLSLLFADLVTGADDGRFMTLELGLFMT